MGSEESKAFTITWDIVTTPPPAACENDTGEPDWEGPHHFELHRSPGSVGSCSGMAGPTSPSADTKVASRGLSDTRWDDFVHRAHKEYGYSLLVCGSTACTSWYGDGSGSSETIPSGSDSDSNCTESEQWELTYITGSSDYDINVVNSRDGGAPHAFFYPSTWPTHANTLALYFSFGVDVAYPSEIRYKRFGTPSWPTNGFNCDNSAGCSTTTPPVCCTSVWANTNSEPLVAEGGTDTGDDDYGADHPWAMPTENAAGTVRWVVLFAQSQHAAANGRRIVQIKSYGPEGTDFDRVCSGGSCAKTIMETGPHGVQGQVAFPIDGASPPYVAQAQHSRVIWPYVEDPIVTEGADEPTMMFQMDLPSSDPGTGCYDADNDDIGRVDGAFASGRWNWNVDVETVGGADCAVTHVENGHDNTMIPLPNDEIKLYYKSWTDELIKVIYWNGSEWEDESQVDFLWYGDTTPWADHECVDNVSVLTRVGGGDIHEGMFFELNGLDRCFESAGFGFDGVNHRVVSAEHVN